MNPFKTIYTVEKNGKVFTLHWKNRYEAMLAVPAAKILSDADVFPTVEKEQARRESTREELGDAGEGILGGLLTGIFTGLGGSVVGTGELIASALSGGGERAVDPYSTWDKTTEFEKKQKDLTSLGWDPFSNFTKGAGLKGVSSPMIGSFLKQTL